MQPRDCQGRFGRQPLNEGIPLEDVAELDGRYESSRNDSDVTSWGQLPTERRRRDLQWAADLVEHIEIIETYAAHGRTAYDDRTQSWSDGIQMRIVKIGHAVDSMSAEFRAETFGEELRVLHGMRSRVAHDYTAVDDDIVWVTATRHLPELRKRMMGVLGQGGPRPR